MLEKNRVIDFLAGLNRELDDVRGPILGKGPLLSTQVAFSEVRTEETRQNVMLNNVGPTIENSTLAFRGSETGGEKKNEKKTERPWCNHCKKASHTRETCWKLHGKPQNWKKKLR